VLEDIKTMLGFKFNSEKATTDELIKFYKVIENAKSLADLTKINDDYALYSFEIWINLVAGIIKKY
jgi:hypothetical protein